MERYNSPYEFAAFLVAALVSILLFAGFTPARWPQRFRHLVLVAAIAHVAGSVARMTIMLSWYGRGDFGRYFRAGLSLGDSYCGLLPLELGPGRLWGTPFVEKVSCVALLLVGPSLRAEFVVFSCFATVGLVLITVAALRAFDNVNRPRLAVLILFWPSLVFWPSSVGKEALILLAVGLVVYGWCGTGTRSRVRWLPLGSGLALAMLIRPHIALMIGVALGVADWLAPLQRITTTRIVRGIGLALVAAVVAASAIQQLGVEAEQEALSEFIRDRSARTVQGGSRMEVSSGPAVVPMAFVNVLARPFLWEAHNPLAVLSAIEVLFFWWLIWRRRTDVWVMLQRWRHNRFLLFIVPLTAVLIFFYGAFVSNMGILARQRVIVLPFMFIIAEAAPAFRSHRHLLRTPRTRAALQGAVHIP